MAEPALSYYGKPIIKEPVWKTEIPHYFFAGGLAGTSATLSAAARAAGNEPLARRALYVAAAGVTVSPYFLIKDLGRPMRFYNMLRVFKVTSPMSVGTWIVAAEGTSTGIAAACQLFGVLPRIRATAQAVSGLLGPAMATYTGALVADSVVPAWHEARHELPLVFAGSSAAAAGGIAAALTPSERGRPARRLGIMGAVTELVTQSVMEKRMGELVAEPYRKGEGGRYARAGQAALLGGTAVMLLAGRTRVGAAVAGTLLATGSWCTRFAVYHAGKTSAGDPAYTSVLQRARVAERGQPAVTRYGKTPFTRL
ncbi:MAG: polysulfide reductase [Actinobacteria bacterium]|nr:MAG: polysulfide reductase [Actinomycetota bacterium]